MPAPISAPCQPTGAREKGLRFGMPAEKMRVVGEPVSLKFIDGVSGQLEARAKLGLAPNLPTLLLVGGGEGMGKLYAIARAIDQAKLPAQLVVIAGRNELLRQRLESVPWQMPVRVEGFVRNMPDWMYAADVIITKAGPGTISEAMACGLPILLSGFLPGQETGNVTFVEQNGIGILQKEPAAIARTLGEWLAPGNDTLARLAMRSHKLSRPRAALEIAKLVDQMLNAEHVA